MDELTSRDPDEGNWPAKADQDEHLDETLPPDQFPPPRHLDHDAARPKPAQPAAPWQSLYDGVDRLSVAGGYLYRIDGQLCFVPGA